MADYLTGSLLSIAWKTRFGKNQIWLATQLRFLCLLTCLSAFPEVHASGPVPPPRAPIPLGQLLHKDAPPANGHLGGPGRPDRSGRPDLRAQRRAGLQRAFELHGKSVMQLLSTTQLPALRHAQTLIGEAFEAQGDPRLAWRYYQDAFRTVRQLGDRPPAQRAVAFADVLDHCYDLLLRQGKTNELQALLHEALAAVAAAQRDPTANAQLSSAAIRLYLHQAEAYLQANDTVSASAALQQASARLQPADVAAPMSGPLPAPGLWRLVWQALKARLAAQQHRPDRQQAYWQAASRTLALIHEPLLQGRAREQLGRYLLQQQHYRQATTVLLPLVSLHRRVDDRIRLRDAYQLLDQAYAGQHRTDSAYYFARRYHGLNDTLREAQQYLALTDMEARYKAKQKEQAIAQLAATADQQRRQKQLAWGGALLLTLLLAGVGYALRHTRRVNKRLAELDDLKNHLFANVSHELRTPLTLIIGPLEHLLHDPAPHAPAALHEQLAVSLRNARRLQHLIDAILDLTKLDAGQLALQPQPTYLALSLQQVVEVFQVQAQYQHIALAYVAQVPPDLRVLCDAGKLELVVTNLLSNALKFTPAGGTVQVELTASGTDAWRVTVRDSGPGIAPEEREKIFERFYQSRQRRAQGGTGIGLAFSRELAGLLQGTLQLEPPAGLGSTFTFSFPAPRLPANSVGEEPTEEELAAVDETGAGEETGERPRVLVVEDNPDLRSFIRRILEPRYTVVEAENGEQALAVLATEAVELVCSDEMMPLLSGTELLLALKAQPHWQRLPFLMVTARGDARHKYESLEIGVDDYLQKPFAPRELLARLHNLLANYRERQQAARPEGTLALGAAGTPALELPTSNSASAAVAMDTADESPLSGADHHFLQQARAVAEAALANAAFGVEEWISQLAVSERTLYRRLKQVTGMTPAAYLRELRLERARTCLEQRTTYTMAEVAYQVGFEDPAYFARLFYKRYGKRATDYLR